MERFFSAYIYIEIAAFRMDNRLCNRHIQFYLTHIRSYIPFIHKNKKLRNQK